jgi:hypothetical protein
MADGAGCGHWPAMRRCLLISFDPSKILFNYRYHMEWMRLKKN